MNIPWRIILFGLFIVSLALLYIANSYMFRARIREYTRIKDSLMFLETYYYHLLSKYTYKTSPQYLDSLLKKNNIELTPGETPPTILEIEDEQ